MVCLGDDGHVAIEAVDFAGGCTDFPEDSASPFPTLVSSHCNDCLDVPVVVDDATHRESGLPLVSIASLTSHTPDWEAPAFQEADDLSFVSLHDYVLPSITTHKIVLII